MSILPCRCQLEIAILFPLNVVFVNLQDLLERDENFDPMLEYGEIEQFHRTLGDIILCVPI